MFRPYIDRVRTRIDGEAAEAERLGQEVLDIRRRVLGPEHPLTLRAMTNLSDSLGKLGRWPEAEKLLTQSLEIQRRILKPNSPDTALSIYNLACVLAHEGKRIEALAMLRDAVDHGLEKWIDLEIDKDPDLKVLHGDPRFQTLVIYAKSVGTGTRKNTAEQSSAVPHPAHTM